MTEIIINYNKTYILKENYVKTNMIITGFSVLTKEKGDFHIEYEPEDNKIYYLVYCEYIDDKMNNSFQYMGFFYNKEYAIKAAKDIRQFDNTYIDHTGSMRNIITIGYENGSFKNIVPEWNKKIIDGLERIHVVSVVKDDGHWYF